MASMDAGRPTWPSKVPADSILKASANPATRAMVRNTPAAVGERQILPVQTNRTPMVMASHPSTALDWSRIRIRETFMPDMANDITKLAHGAHYIAPDIHGQNFFTIDRQFQDLLSLYMDPGLRAEMLPHFDRLGALAGNRLD